MSASEIAVDIRKSKEELDAERHFLGTTVRLSDGTEGLVFSRGTKNEAGLFLYNCHLCGVANLPGERSLRTHVTGKKHQTKFSQSIIDAFAFRTSLTQKPKIPMNIAPGEPVPPGFENEVKPMAEIQQKLDSYQETALIGVEYTCEILDIDTSYCCLLCDKWEDQKSIFSHLTSYNHRLKYLEKHFTGVVKELVPYRYNPESRNIMPKVVQKVAEAIEDHHGRLSPSVYDSSEFRKNRNKIYQEMLNEKHFDEKNGPNFINIVDKRKIDEMIKTSKGSISISIESNKRRNLSPPNSKRSDMLNIRKGRDSLDSISSESDSELTLGGSKLDRQKRRKQSDSPLGRIRSRVKRSPPFEEEYNTVRKVTLPTPKELSKQASEIAQERYKWEKYRCLMDIAIKGLEKILKDHEKNPEKHPLYPEEWKKFWNRRYKELQNEKKDPNKHDYKPEWIVFWTKRMKELHDEEIERKKCEVRKKLGLPDDAEERTDQLKQQYIVKAPSLATTTLKSRSSNRGSPQVIDISDDEESISSPPKSKRSRRSNTKSMSPFSDDDLLDEKKKDRHRSRDVDADFDRDKEKEWERVGKSYPARDYYRYPSGSSSKYPPNYYGHTYGSYRTMDPYNYPKYEPVNEKEVVDDNEPLTVVAVLRLLTALEDHLGSLGPKVVDLLAKALALEKVKANSSDDMLLNDDTSVFFETVKEKLKGQLIADVLDSNKIKAVKKAIQKIAAVIHQVNDKTSKKLKEGEKVENENSSEKSISDLPFDRKLVVSKLAAALVMQQKMDVSTEEMDKLIHSFVLMVKLSKDRKRLVFVKDMLVELGVLLPELDITDSQNVEKPKLTQQQKEYENTTNENVINETTNTGNNEEEQEDEITSATGALDSLTDSDLQTLLQNFKHLSSEEQHHLIAHLKKLEATDPVRVEKLRKYVNVTDSSKESKSKSSPVQKRTPKLSSNNENDNITTGQKNSLNIDDEEDEDDDYNFEDVVKVVKNRKNTNEGKNSISSIGISNDNNSKNKNIRSDSSLIRDDEVSNMSRASNSSASVNISLSDTQNLITNLMGSLQKANATFSQSNSTNSGSELNSIPTISNRNTTQTNTSYYMQSQQHQPHQQSQGIFAQQQSQQHSSTSPNFNYLSSLSNPYSPTTNGGNLNTFNNFQNQFPNFQMPSFNPIPTPPGNTAGTRDDILQSNSPQVLQGFIAQQQNYRNQRTGNF